MNTFLLIVFGFLKKFASTALRTSGYLVPHESNNRPTPLEGNKYISVDGANHHPWLELWDRNTNEK